MRCRGHCLRKVTVEPVAFLALLSLSLLDQVSQQYVYKKLKVKSEVLQQNATSLNNMTDSCNTSTTSNLYSLSENVLKTEAGHWWLYLKISAVVPAIFTSLILGIWSDKVGRKIGLIIAMCGGLIQVSVHLLVVNLDLSIFILLIGNIASGVSGHVTLTIAICMAYIADVTSKQYRTIQIMILSTVIGVGTGLAMLISDYWIDNYGLVPPLWLIFGFSIVNIIYIIFFVPETIIREYRSILFMTNWKIYLTHICRLVCSNNVYSSIWSRLVTIYVMSFFIVKVVWAGCGEVMLTYSVHWPLCFDEVYVQYFSGMVTCSFITSLVAVKLLQLVPWLSNDCIIEFGLLSTVVGLIIAAFAKTTIMMFMVPVAALLAQIPLAVLRACLSKIVDFHQQGLLFAVLGCTESIGWLVGYFTFNSLYFATKHILTGMTFLLGAGVLIIPIILLGIIQFYQGYRSYNMFVESITSHEEGSSSSDSEDSETSAILGQNKQGGNHSYKTYS